MVFISFNNPFYDAYFLINDVDDLYYCQLKTWNLYSSEQLISFCSTTCINFTLLMFLIVIWFHLHSFRLFVYFLTSYTRHLASSKNSPIIWSTASCWKVSWVWAHQLPWSTQTAFNSFWYKFWKTKAWCRIEVSSKDTQTQYFSCK